MIEANYFIENVVNEKLKFGVPRNLMTKILFSN